MNFLDERLPARFWDKVSPCPMSGCWIWTAGCSKAGYGNYGIRTNEMRSSHRVAYEALVGPVPDGLQLDHKCRVRACCNPAHLEVVTNRENCLRGNAPTAQNARKTTCKEGHPLPGPNYRGQRVCRVCVRARRREAKAGPVRIRKAPRPEPIKVERKKTRCPRGHLYAGDNLFVSKDGRRICRACALAHKREYRARKKAA